MEIRGRKYSFTVDGVEDRAETANRKEFEALNELHDLSELIMSEATGLMLECAPNLSAKALNWYRREMYEAVYGASENPRDVSWRINSRLRRVEDVLTAVKQHCYVEGELKEVEFRVN